ncbi:unnamed protein product [Microthlaspi erraticum]|uniref:Uncharacterized protein n=1 Tax=Microthlaspi erraticum TaxID=1685480 RepID=A0A6D2HMY6_9BRAS|nr:unnamed protein product [Microthlaspi erraticum]
MSKNFFDQLMTIVHDMLREGNVLPKSTEEIKKFMKVFGFGYDIIHTCKNDAFCIGSSTRAWKVAHDVVLLGGRWTNTMVRSSVGDGQTQCNASEDGTMRHPVDSLTWAQVNDSWPEFAGEPRNLRLGLFTDEMNPFSIQNMKHSTWPVLLVNYNMSPTKCMKAENIMLTMLIPGLTAPSNNIDVYLAPLIDDLKDLWAEGIEVYGSFLKENFTLKALLLWSISDYPGLGTLSGCKVKGKKACNVCGKDTPSRWLKFSRKYVYMGNRKRLRLGHPYRRRKAWFDNTIEKGTPNRIQTRAKIFDILSEFRNDFGRPLDKETKRKRSELCEEELSSEEDEEDSDQWRWKKRSIFFELFYCKELPVRHNIYMMHMEKNISEVILSTLMHSTKSKNGLKARKDLEDIGIRRHLHTELRGKRTYLPSAAF